MQAKISLSQKPFLICFLDLKWHLKRGANIIWRQGLVEYPLPLYILIVLDNEFYFHRFTTDFCPAISFFVIWEMFRSVFYCISWPIFWHYFISGKSDLRAKYIFPTSIFPIPLHFAANCSVLLLFVSTYHCPLLPLGIQWRTFHWYNQAVMASGMKGKIERRMCIGERSKNH